MKQLVAKQKFACIEFMILFWKEEHHSLNFFIENKVYYLLGFGCVYSIHIGSKVNGPNYFVKIQGTHNWTISPILGLRCVTP